MATMTTVNSYLHNTSYTGSRHTALVDRSICSPLPKLKIQIQSSTERKLQNRVPYQHNHLCMVIRFFHPCSKGQWPWRIFYPRFYPFVFPIIILEKEPVIPFLMLSAKQGNYWYHFYRVFGMTQFLTGDWTWNLLHLKPAIYH